MNPQWRRDHGGLVRSKSAQPSRQAFFGFGVGDGAAILDGAFAAGNALQNAEAAAEGVKGLHGHEIGGGFAVLGDEHGDFIGLKISDDFGGLALEGGHEFGAHEVPLVVPSDSRARLEPTLLEHDAQELGRESTKASRKACLREVDWQVSPYTLATRRRREASETKPTNRSAAEVGSGAAAVGVKVLRLVPAVPALTLSGFFATSPASSRNMLIIG